MVYGILREVKGKAYAEAYRHKRNKKHAEYGTGLKVEKVWTIIRDYGIDGYLMKRFIPGGMTEAEKAEFEDYEWIELRWSPYDCTGRAFSQWMSFHDVPGGTWVYHSIGFDV